MFSKKTCGLPSGRPSFIKISLRFARVVEAPTPTGLCDICCFDCRGDQWSSVVYKNIIAICPGSRGRLPLPVCVKFNLLLVGAIHNVCKANLRLAKQSPLDSRGRLSLQGLTLFLKLMPVGENSICSRILQSLRHFLAKMPPPFTQGRRLFGSHLIIWCHLS